MRQINVVVVHHLFLKIYKKYIKYVVEIKYMFEITINNFFFIIIKNILYIYIMVDYKKKYLKYKNKYLQAKKNIKIKGGTGSPSLSPQKWWDESPPLSPRETDDKSPVWSKLRKSISESYTGKSPIVVQPKISISSYNISWATQLNDAPWFASEADFVTECQRRYPGEGGKKCFDNAIKSINEAINEHDIKLIGFQEVAPTGDSSEELKTFSEKLNWAFDHSTYTDTREMGDDKKPVTTALVSMWDPTIFGNIVKGEIFNLTEDDKDNRPCTIIITNNTIIINAHFPWVTPENLEKCQEKISTELNKMLRVTSEEKTATLKEIDHIIFVGDTNDAEGLINSENPLVLHGDNFEFKLHNGLTQEDTKEKLRTCCWHAPGHKYYQENKSPGDYAIIMKIEEKKPNKFETVFLDRTHHHIIETERPRPPPVDLKSDHDPIITTVNI